MAAPSRSRLAAGVVYPDFGAADAAIGLGAAVGALLTAVLIVAILMLIVCAVSWAYADAKGNYLAAVRARAGLFVALGAAVLAGAATTWGDFLIDVGAGM